MRTAERHSGLRRIAPEPRAPMSANPKKQLVKNQKNHSDQKNKQKNTSAGAIPSSPLNFRQFIINHLFLFSPHIYIITGFRQERGCSKQPGKIKFVSYQRGERQTGPPHIFCRAVGRELLHMLRRCAASQQGIITQWQRWMTPRTHF